MPRWYIRDSVRIEPQQLQQNLLPANFTVDEYEQLLLRHGFVVAVLGDGLYSVNFITRNINQSHDVVLTINEAGLRVVWHVGQVVRANTRFYNAACMQILAHAGVRAEDIYPLSNFDITGIIQRDVGTGTYSVMMRLPRNNHVQVRELQVDSYQLHAVWNIGDSVHLISYVSETGRHTTQNLFPNTNIEQIRSWVCRIDAAADNINYRYNVSMLPVGRVNRVFFLVQGLNLRSSGPACFLEMDHTGAMSSSDSDDFI